MDPEEDDFMSLHMRGASVPFFSGVTTMSQKAMARQMAKQQRLAKKASNMANLYDNSERRRVSGSNNATRVRQMESALLGRFGG